MWWFGPNQYYECDGSCTNDIDGDGVCDELEIEGCQDSIADNYDVNATDSASDLLPTQAVLILNILNMIPLQPLMMVHVKL